MVLNDRVDHWVVIGCNISSEYEIDLNKIINSSKYQNIRDDYLNVGNAIKNEIFERNITLLILGYLIQKYLEKNNIKYNKEINEILNETNLDNLSESRLYLTEEEIKKTLNNFFNLTSELDLIIEKISVDQYIKKAVKNYYGLRLINQDFFEAMISFIVSSFNNIKRIKK